MRSVPATEAKILPYRPTYNLGQIKWNIATTPPPKINDEKMARFGLHMASSLIWGRGGISVPFYSVQDCLLSRRYYSSSVISGNHEMKHAFARSIKSYARFESTAASLLTELNDTGKRDCKWNFLLAVHVLFVFN